MTEIPLPEGKKVYFASDFHLGAPDMKASHIREKRIVRWLDEIEEDAAHIFLVGDLFDFWFEYKKVIPKGYTRLLGKLAALSDRGTGISVFIGNHDMWMDGYFEEELHIPVYVEPQRFTIGGKLFYIGHGDGLGPGDQGYKMMKKVFRHPLSRWLFAALHPSWGISLADYLSRRSRSATQLETFLGEDREWLVTYCKSLLQQEHADYFIFGHRHLPLDIRLGPDSRYINLGDWINYYSYAVFDGADTSLVYYGPE
ncbi:UDP-2,3-diacylglucosamine diphosphatase [Compostibacter hankyongensis]|uniref:UDP-2,3-diacylglucosamine diphosphatase n=1 Tax=Compostibacter hankyongensis TaxID=1007089 RepID=A0ABP8FSZ4_9BACT